MTVSPCLVPENDLERQQKPWSSRLVGQAGSCPASHSTERCHVSVDSVCVPEKAGSRELKTGDFGLNLRWDAECLIRR